MRVSMNKFTVANILTMGVAPLAIVYILSCISVIGAISDGGIDAGGTFEPGSSNMTNVTVPVAAPIPAPIDADDVKPPPSMLPPVTDGNTTGTVLPGNTSAVGNGTLMEGNLTDALPLPTNTSGGTNTTLNTVLEGNLTALTDVTLTNSNKSMFDSSSKSLMNIINDFAEAQFDEYGLSFFREE